MGDPREHLSRERIARIAETDPTILRDFVTCVTASFADSSYRGVVLASKLFPFQLDALRGEIIPDVSIEETFRMFLKLCRDPKVIRLIRLDKLMQSISYVNAIKTGSWSAFKGDRESGFLVDESDFYEIYYWRNALIEWELDWDRLINACGIEPLHIYYEEVADKIEHAAMDVASFVGIQFGDEGSLSFNVRTMKQSSGEGVQLAKAFRKWERAFFV